MKPQSISPGQALCLLTEGNKRFAAGRPEHPHTNTARLREILAGQSPFAVVVTCSDSRVPAERIFDCGFGDIFVIRVAGNCLDSTVIGSIQYAVHHLACPLVVILGHESCGAVTASIGAETDADREPPAIAHIIRTIRSNIPLTLSQKDKGPGKLDRAIRENARTVVKQLTDDPVIAGYVSGGSLRILTAYYSLTTGIVAWDGE
jgi:carbonic anhydrase